MKRFLLSVMLFATVIAIEAKRIPQPQAAQIAASFMKKWSNKPSVRRLNAVPKQFATNATDKLFAPFYIYNNDGGQGFVIVSGDDALGTILAYSDKGSFSFNNAPDNLMFWMESYAKRIEAITDTNAEDTNVEHPTPVVKPLLGDIEWGQDAPYNNDCPIWNDGKDDHHFYVGCVATAAAQIMRFYKHPLHGMGQHEYTAPIYDEKGRPTTQKLTLNANFANDTYEWDKMLPRYRDTDYTDEQAKAVALISARLGIATDMQYGKTGSGTYSPNIPYALRTFFGYDNSIQYLMREHYSTSQWIAIIKHELDKGRPVYYSASSADGLGGHAFVCDGYDNRDFVHINWGWHGNSNGYYMVNHMNPPKLGIGADKSGFNVNQEIVINIKPAGQTPTPIQYTLSSPTRFSMLWYDTDFSLSAYIENYDLTNIEYTIAAVLVKDGKIVKILKEEDKQLKGYTNGKAAYDAYWMRKIGLEADGLADGDYHVNFAYKVKGQQNYNILRHPVGLASYAVATVKDGKIIAKKDYVPQPDVKLLTKIEFDGDLYSNGVGLAKVKLQNKTKDFNLKRLIFKFTAVSDSQTVYLSDTLRTSIYEDCTETFESVIKLPKNMKEGNYNVQLYHARFDNFIFDDTEVGTTTVEIKPELTTPLLRQATALTWLNVDTQNEDPILQGKKILMQCDARNYGTQGIAGLVACFKNIETKKEYVFLRNDNTFEKGGTKTLRFYKELPLDPGEYEVTLARETNDKLEPLTSFFEPVKIKVETNPDLLLKCTDIRFSDVLIKGKREIGAVVLTTLKNIDNSLKGLKMVINLRKLDNRGGEIVTMSNIKETAAGLVLRAVIKYTPADKLENGLYMLSIVARHGFGTKAKEYPVGGHDTYYRLVKLTTTDGITTITAVENNDEIFTEQQGDKLNIYTASSDIEIKEIALYATDGTLLNHVRGNINSIEVPQGGIYILKVTTDKQCITKKIKIATK